MAIRSSSPTILIPIKATKTATRASMVHNSTNQHNRAPALLHKSCIINKVFEDQKAGIACYTDEKGELICEGYDEGPRISREHKQDVCQRVLRMTDLQQLRLQIKEYVDCHGVNGVSVQELN